MATTSVTVRLPNDLIERIRQQANESGVTFSDVVSNGLKVFLGLPDPEVALLGGVAAYVAANYSDDEFPPDVILRTFHHVRDSELRPLYEAAIAAPDGRPDENARHRLHKHIGKTVKRALNAEVFGRSIPFSTREHLLLSYSFLRPCQSAAVCAEQSEALVPRG